MYIKCEIGTFVSFSFMNIDVPQFGKLSCDNYYVFSWVKAAHKNTLTQNSCYYRCMHNMLDVLALINMIDTPVKSLNRLITYM